MSASPKTMSSKRNIIILVIVLAVIIIGGIVAAVAVGTSGKTDIAETLTLAERYLDEENYEQAIIEFERILEIDPMNVAAYLGKAEALIALGDVDGAKALLEEAYELTGSEAIKAVLDGLEETETSTVSTTSTASTNTAASEENEPETPVADMSVEMAVFPYKDEYCHSIEVMLFEYFNRGGRLDTDMLANVTALDMYGTAIISVSCGDKIGSVINWDYWMNGKEHIEMTMEDGTVYQSPGISIDNIDFVKYLTSCTVLHLRSGYVEDISALRGLTGLTELTLTQQDISNISPIEGLTALTALNLEHNQIVDISPLAGLVNLKELNLSENNQLSDISSLSGLAAMQELQICYTQVVDISALSGMAELRTLYMYMNQISDLTPLGGLKNLWYIDLGSNNISDVSPLFNLMYPSQIILDRNQVPPSDGEKLKSLYLNCHVTY